ncbi:MAG: DUF134 domain-containing protein [Lachnospiraceae bacterium]|nr:DUF134 domain-containing protein [Lachnospiraceae bacterium]MDD3660897.1 DUF134 domain-containing protein [Lachnospiraceae bacterium]
MARPTKWRKIDHIPKTQYFIPSEDRMEEGMENILKLEELEALRLKDLEGLEQDECAERMEVSRPTFQRILLLAREKVADSLINGKAVSIEGGNFTRNICPVVCMDCGKEWKESFENLERLKKGEYACQNCGSVRIVCRDHCKGKFCNKNCNRNGRRDS